MKKLMVTAEDVGASADLNRAAREARAEGVITNVALLATGAAWEEAADWARSDSSVGVGAHLDLEKFFQKDDRLPPAAWDYKDPQIPVSDILAEMEAQVGRLLGKGLALWHLSSRHHLHLRPELFPLACDIAEKHHVRTVRFFSTFYNAYPGIHMPWLMGVLSRRNLIALPHFIQGWYWGNVDEPFTAAELACRPSHEDDAGRRDLYACRDPRLKDYLRRQNTQLITPADFVREYSFTAVPV